MKAVDFINNGFLVSDQSLSFADFRQGWMGINHITLVRTS